MKILLITDNRPWALTMQSALSAHEVQVASQDEALSAFLDLEPEATLVSEHEVIDNIGEKWQKAARNFKDICAAATPEQKVLCCGFLMQEGPGFLRLPFSPQEFLARIS